MVSLRDALRRMRFFSPTFRSLKLIVNEEKSVATLRIEIDRKMLRDGQNPCDMCINRRLPDGILPARMLPAHTYKYTCNKPSKKWLGEKYMNEKCLTDDIYVTYRQLTGIYSYSQIKYSIERLSIASLFEICIIKKVFHSNV